MSWKYVAYEYPYPVLVNKILTWISANTNVYFTLKLNDTDSWTYYGGTAAHALATGMLLTEYATEAEAQTNYLTTVRDTVGKVLVILPLNKQAKYVNMYVQTGSGIQIYEFRPSAYFVANEIVSGTLEISDQLSDAPLIKVVKSGVDRVKIGNFASTYYGIAGYDSSGNLIFELSDHAQTLAGWTFNQYSLTCQSGQVGLNSQETEGVDWRIWAGNATPGSAPFRVDENGNVVASSATITGTINATSGYLETLTLGKTGVASGTLNLQLYAGHGDTYIAAGKTDFDNTVAGFILGLDDSDSDKAKFYMGDSTQYLNWDGSVLTYTKGTLVETTIQMYTSLGVLKTSATAGDGSAASAGMVLTYEGLFGCGANQTSTIAAGDANIRILATGDAYYRGTLYATDGDFEGSVSIGAAENVVIDGANEQIVVYGTSVSVTAGYNNYLDWSENGSVKSTSLSAGSYTFANFASEVQSKMRAAGDSNTTVSYSNTTRKITIANSSLTTLSLLWNTGSNKNYSCGKALGFVVSADDTGALTYTGDYKVGIRVVIGKLNT